MKRTAGRSRNCLRFGSLLTAALAAAVAVAQDPPPQDPEKPADPPAAPAKRNLIEVGFGHWSRSGNEHKVRQYATPVEGIFIKEFRFLNPSSAEKEPFAQLVYRGELEEDFAGSAYGLFDHGKVALSFSKTNFHYYDPSPYVNPESQDESTKLGATIALGAKAQGFLRYQRTTRDHWHEPPRIGHSDRLIHFAGGVQGRVLGGDAGIVLGNYRFFDRLGNQPDSIRRKALAYYGRNFSDALSLEGVYGYTQIEQRNLYDSSSKNYGLNGAWAFGPDSTLFFFANRQDVRLPNVLNAYVRQRFDVGGRIVHRLGDVSMQFGYRHREAERYRTSQSFVDVPKWDRYEGRISGRFAGALRYSLRGSFEHLSDAAAMEGTDNRQLYWDDRVRAQFKIDGGNDRFAGYAAYDYRFDQNSPRDLEVSCHQITVGGSWSFNPTASGYLEISSETFEAQGVDDGVLGALDDFFPSSTSIAAGLNWTLTGNATLGTTLTHYFTRNANPLLLQDGNVRGTQLLASYRKQIDADRAIEATISPWRHTDRLVDQMGYRTTVFTLSYQTKF